MSAGRRRVAAELLNQAEAKRMCVAPTTLSGRQAMRRAFKRGDVVEPAAGIYARISYWETLDDEQRAWHKIIALAQAHPNWIFAGPTAGLVHGLSIGYRDLSKIYVATSRKAHARPSQGIARIVVTGDSPVMRHDLKVTSFLRTVYDCTREATFGQALAVMDSALRIKRMTPERLIHNLRITCGHRRNIRRVLEVAGLGDGKSESGGESIARAAMMHIGVPLPALQVEVVDPVDGESVYRVDFEWKLPDGTRVYGELDGTEKYVNPTMTHGKSVTEVLLDERRREAHITLGSHPIRVLRVSLHDVMDVEVFEKTLARYGIVRTRDPMGVMKEWP